MDFGLGSALALSGLLAGAAIKTYDFFEGETFLRDCLDEFRLSRLGLAECQRMWEINPTRSDAVLSLTSIPSRLPFVERTVKSLLRQSAAPSRIVLNLPWTSKRESVPYTVPEAIARLPSVSVERCADLGPATKLLPTLQREPPRTKIIVVDDDRVYPANLVADLSAAADAGPDCAFGMSGWIVPPDLIDRPTTVWSNAMMQPPAPIRARRLRTPRRVDILQGLSGYIVRPDFFDLAKVSDYGGAPPEAYFVDDVWISGHCRVPRFVIPARRSNYQAKLLKSHYRRTSLGRINRGSGSDAERNNSIVIRYLQDRWMTKQAPSD